MHFLQTHKITILLIAIIVIGGLFFVTQNNEVTDDGTSVLEETEQTDKTTTENGTTATPSTTSKPAPSQPKNAGRLVFTITDAAVNLEDIDSLLMTLSDVLVHSPTQGWLSLSGKPLTYDLLLLKKEGKPELMLDLNVEAGMYDQLRLPVSSLIVIKGGIAQTAKIPSGELRVPFTLKVEKDTISVIKLDVLADISLHTTGNGTYIFTPVIHVQTLARVDTIQKAGGKKIDILGGTTQFDATFGMDENGNTKINYSINQSILLDLVRKNILVLMPYTINRTDLKITAEEAIDKALSGTGLSTVSSVRLVEKGKARAWQIVDVRGGASKSVFIDAMTGELISIE